MFNVKKIDENNFFVNCPKKHRHPNHTAAVITIENDKTYFNDGGEKVELSIEEMKEIVGIMEKIEKGTK